MSSNDHALVVHFHLCSANDNRTSDGHYFTLEPDCPADEQNRQMVFRTPSYVLLDVWGVIVCLHKVVCD